MSTTTPSTTLLPENIFVPEQYPFANPATLFSLEKPYIKLILQISETFIAHNLMNLVIEGWYNVTFDNYPTLRSLLPANYPDTIVGLATQVTVAIQNLDVKDEKNLALQKQFTPIGRRHYMHGAEAVTLLCSAPCLVQSMYNVLTLTIDRVVALLEGVLDYANFFIKALEDAGIISRESAGSLHWSSRETALLESVSLKPVEFDRPKGARLTGESTQFTTPESAVLMMDPPDVRLGAAVPQSLVDRVVNAVTLAPREGAATPPSEPGVEQAPPEPQPDYHERLAKIVHDLPAPLWELIEPTLDPIAAAQIDAFRSAPLTADASGHFEKSILDGILDKIVAFVLRYVLPVVLIPFGRFVNCMVGVITDGVRSERSERLLQSWETHLEPRVDELARRFWLTLKDISPSTRFALGLQTGPQLEYRLNQLTEELARALTVSFPRIIDGGKPFKEELMKMGQAWSAAGWSIDGYDGVRQAFLAVIDAMLFSASPVYARTIPAIRLKDAYSQLVSVVLTEFIYGAGGNSFKPVGGILGLPVPNTT